ncbi:MAG: 2-oxoisovalerate dehydrogenase [Planctomycetota bacterium]|nr:2-oxoisovalerate dehydrogenase [Planctomycetota bacterium]
MTEMVFQVEDDPDGGLTARAVGESIFVEADSIDELRQEIRDAVTCHFATPGDRPKVIRLHFVRDEVITL